VKNYTHFRILDIFGLSLMNGVIRVLCIFLSKQLSRELVFVPSVNSFSSPRLRSSNPNPPHICCQLPLQQTGLVLPIGYFVTSAHSCRIFDPRNNLCFVVVKTSILRCNVHRLIRSQKIQTINYSSKYYNLFFRSFVPKLHTKIIGIWY